MGPAIDDLHHQSFTDALGFYYVLGTKLNINFVDNESLSKTAIKLHIFTQKCCQRIWRAKSPEVDDTALPLDTTGGGHRTAPNLHCCSPTLKDLTLPMKISI